MSRVRINPDQIARQVAECSLIHYQRNARIWTGCNREIAVFQKDLRSMAAISRAIKVMNFKEVKRILDNMNPNAREEAERILIRVHPEFYHGYILGEGWIK